MLVVKKCLKTRYNIVSLDGALLNSYNLTQKEVCKKYGELLYAYNIKATSVAVDDFSLFIQSVVGLKQHFNLLVVQDGLETPNLKVSSKYHLDRTYEVLKFAEAYKPKVKKISKKAQNTLDDYKNSLNFTFDDYLSQAKDIMKTDFVYCAGNLLPYITGEDEARSYLKNVLFTDKYYTKDYYKDIVTFQISIPNKKKVYTLAFYPPSTNKLKRDNL